LLITILYCIVIYKIFITSDIFVLFWLIIIIMQKKGLNIVITGGNSGIGFETMKDLYLRGHNIIFGSRN